MATYEVRRGTNTLCPFDSSVVQAGKSRSVLPIECNAVEAGEKLWIVEVADADAHRVGWVLVTHTGGRAPLATYWPGNPPDTAGVVTLDNVPPVARKSGSLKDGRRKR